MEDLEILELYFKRDERAIKETDVKYGKLCHSIAYNILGSDCDSQECVNDTYMGIWNSIPPTRPQNFMAFICKITRNVSLNRLTFLTREKRSSDLTVSFGELAEILPDDKFSPGMDDAEVGEIISCFLRAQKADVRNVFIRRYYFFDSVEEIAKRYSFSQSKVKNILFRTRNKLRDYLIEEGVRI